LLAADNEKANQQYNNDSSERASDDDMKDETANIEEADGMNSSKS
jgi:hypothetical protein